MNDIGLNRILHWTINWTIHVTSYVMNTTRQNKNEEYHAPSTAQAHGDLLLRDETLAKPYKGREKGRRSHSPKQGTEGNPQGRRETLSRNSVRSSGIDLHGQCKPLLMMERERKEEEGKLKGEGFYAAGGAGIMVR